MINALTGGRASGPRTGRHVRRPVPVMEQVEDRRLMTAVLTTYSDDTVTTLAGSYFGSVTFGENGYPDDGEPTVVAGTGATPVVSGFTTWDSNLDDGLDSQYVPFQFGLNAGGDGVSTIEASDSGTMAFATGTSISVHQVSIQAAVAQPDMEMDWRSVTVNFYRGGQLVESVNVGDLKASTLNSAGSTAAESIVTVTASASNYDGVSVVGQVRLAAAQGTCPNMADIFGKVTVA